MKRDNETTKELIKYTHACFCISIVDMQKEYPRKVSEASWRV